MELNFYLAAHQGKDRLVLNSVKNQWVSQFILPLKYQNGSHVFCSTSGLGEKQDAGNILSLICDVRMFHRKN